MTGTLLCNHLAAGLGSEGVQWLVICLFPFRSDPTESPGSVGGANPGSPRFRDSSDSRTMRHHIGPETSMLPSPR